jgi:hypothetical protein
MVEVLATAEEHRGPARIGLAERGDFLPGEAERRHPAHAGEPARHEEGEDADGRDRRSTDARVPPGSSHQNLK